jgi:hypothetical protein
MLGYRPQPECMGLDEVLDFFVDCEGDAFWRRHCPEPYPPIDEHDQVDLARAAGRVQGADSGLALPSNCESACKSDPLGWVMII